MGWSTWNTFGLNISEDVIKSQAEALVELGLSEVGYKYVNIDDGFWEGRNDDGSLCLNTRLFPNGMRFLTDYIHELGLYAGIYSDAGDNTCASNNIQPWGLGVGLYGHEIEDCELYFGAWNFDLIKVDYCGGIHLNLDERTQYTNISNAIKQIAKKYNKDIHFNVCRWAYPGTWISDVADSWRTTSDIFDGWISVKKIINENLYLSAYSSAGHYNDMDMLEVGRSMSEEEDKTHFGMWCMMNSPLLIGCDLRTIDKKTLSLLKNKELIAINQDVLGAQAYVIKHTSDTYILAKDLEIVNGKKRAVAFYNPTDDEKNMSISFVDLELSEIKNIRDVFNHGNVTVRENGISILVPPHGTRIFVVNAGRRLERCHYEGEQAFLRDYEEIKGGEHGQYCERTNASGGMVACNLGSRESNDLSWRNIFSQEGGIYLLSIAAFTDNPRQFSVEVNEVFIDSVFVENSYGNEQITEIIIPLHKGMNKIRFSNSLCSMPDIDYIILNKYGSSDLLWRKFNAVYFYLCSLNNHGSITSAIDCIIANTIEQFNRPDLQREDSIALVEKSESIISSVDAMRYSIQDFQKWKLMSNQLLESSETNTESYNRFIRCVENADIQFDSAYTDSMIIEATDYLKLSLKSYLTSDDSRPKDGFEFDMTALIDNNDFSTSSGWQDNPFYNYGCAEVFDRRFDVYQILGNLKPGNYTLSCNALYRKSYNDYGEKGETTNDTTYASLYANDFYTPVTSLFRDDWPNAENVTPDNIDRLPRMYVAERNFQDGFYYNCLSFNLQEKGDVRLGIKVIVNNYGNWCCFDNFKLKYTPYTIDTGISHIRQEMPSTSEKDSTYELNGMPALNKKTKRIIIRRGKKYFGVY